MRSLTSFWLASTLPILTGCDRALGPDIAAVAASFELGIEDAAQIVAPVSALPNDPGVIETTLDFWIDYTLLAWTVNEEGALDALDISDMVNQELERSLVLHLRGEVIQVDTSITEEELEASFDEERPGDEVRARHVLLTMGPAISEAQRDSLQALAEEIRDRARAGEDFGALAEQYSEDPGSAASGGDLGFFARGVMVPPFEEAAFGLQPGEVSDVVQSQFGLHVIQVAERRGPSFAEIAVQYRAQLQSERTTVAESIYLAELEGPANVQIGAEAVELLRRITAAPADRLSTDETASQLTRWEGGEYLAGEYQEFLSMQPTEIRQQITQAQDEQLETLLRDLTRDRILVAEAERLGIELTAEEAEEIVSQVQGQYLLIAGLPGSGFAPGRGGGDAFRNR